MGCQNENDIDAKTAGVFFGALMSAEHDMFAPTVLLLFDAWHEPKLIDIFLTALFFAAYAGSVHGVYKCVQSAAGSSSVIFTPQMLFHGAPPLV